MHRFTLPACLAGVLSLGISPLPAPAAGDGDPATPVEAMDAARPLLEVARRKGPDGGKEVTDGLKKAIALLKGKSKEGLQEREFQVLWNEAISLGEWHGVKSLPDYHMQDVEMPSHPVRFSFPVGRGWSWIPKTPGKDQQNWGEVRKTLVDGRLIRIIRFWIYRWDTTYSGTGGENVKALAEDNMMADRDALEKVTRRSDRVVPLRLSAGFPKAYYYEVAGEDKEVGPLRKRNWYVKGSETSYNFEVVEYRKAEVRETPWLRWQIEAEDPELKAILASFAEVRRKK